MITRFSNVKAFATTALTFHVGVPDIEAATVALLNVIDFSAFEAMTWTFYRQKPWHHDTHILLRSDILRLNYFKGNFITFLNKRFAIIRKVIDISTNKIFKLAKEFQHMVQFYKTSSRSYHA